MSHIPWKGAVAGLIVTLAACGGGGPSSPSPNPSSAKVTITASGVNPKSVQITIGGRVTFVNADTRSHAINSNPHPVHTDCPEINQVGSLQPGQSRDTGSFPTARSCGYHDHDAPDNTSVQGTIVIQ